MLNKLRNKDAVKTDGKIDCFDVKTLKAEKKIELTINAGEIEEATSINCIFIYKDDEYKAQAKLEKNILSIDLSDFAKNKKRLGNGFKAYIEAKMDNQTYLYEIYSTKVMHELSNQDKKHYNRENRVYDSFDIAEYKGNNYICFSYFDEESVFCIQGVKESEYHTRIIRAKIIYAKIKKNFFYVKIRYPKCSYEYKGLRLSFRATKQDDREIYEIETQKVKENSQYVYYKGRINLNEINFRPIFWDLQLIAEKEGKECHLALKNMSLEFVFRYTNLFAENLYNFKDGMFVYPSPVKNRSIALQYRERGKYDGIGFRFKERVSLVLYILFFWYFKKNKIYLVYEKYSTMAQDNGYYFFKYCMENDIEKEMGAKIYYIIDKNSPDYEKVAKYKNRVLDFMSYKHIVYLLGAKLMISTDTRNHAYAWRKKGNLLYVFWRNKKIVFLQHGVTAMKKVDFFYGKGKSGGCDLFVVTSDYEKDIVLKNFDYSEDEIAVTGFARWDVLKDKSNGSRDILLMPTWRNWLDEVGDELFKESDYYKNYTTLLTSKELENILKEKNLTLYFYLHPKFKDYIDNFISNINFSDRIRLIPFGEIQLNELMMQCRMLITDYSSVSWDVYYQNKPVIFYQFDLPYYLEAHGSYMDMDKELFGEKARDVSHLIGLIAEYADADFKVKTEFEKNREYYYKYIDDDNSKRICEEIKKKGW